MFRVFCFPLCGGARSPQRMIPTLSSVSPPFSTSLSRPSSPAAVKELRFQGCSWHLHGPGLITEVALPGHSHLKKQQSTSCQKILFLCKASSRTNHVGFPDPHQLCTSPLVRTVYGEPLDAASAGEGKNLNCTPVPCYEGAVRRPFQPTSKASAIPHARWSSETLAAHIPQVLVGWGRASVWAQASLAREPMCFQLACHLTRTAGSPSLTTTPRSPFPTTARSCLL